MSNNVAGVHYLDDKLLVEDKLIYDSTQNIRDFAILPGCNYMYMLSFVHYSHIILSIISGDLLQ